MGEGEGACGTHDSFAICRGFHIFVGFTDQHGPSRAKVAIGWLPQWKYVSTETKLER